MTKEPELFRPYHHLESVSELDTVFARYSECYMASDVEAISALRAAYAASGATRADIARLDVTGLGRSSALATVNWQVRDADGALLKDYRTTYQLLSVDGNRRILAYTNHDE